MKRESASSSSSGMAVDYSSGKKFVIPVPTSGIWGARYVASINQKQAEKALADLKKANKPVKVKKPERSRAEVLAALEQGRARRAALAATLGTPYMVTKIQSRMVISHDGKMPKDTINKMITPLDRQWYTASRDSKTQRYKYKLTAPNTKTTLNNELRRRIGGSWLK